MKKLLYISIVSILFQFGLFAQIPLPGGANSNTSKPKPKPKVEATVEEEKDVEDSRANIRSSKEDDLSNLYLESERIQHSIAIHKLITEVIKGAAYIIRQDYLIQDPNGKQIGRNDNDMFGRDYGVAVASDGKIWSLTSNINPWLEDKNFERYKKDHEPIRSITALRKIDEQEFKKMEMNVFVDDVDRIGYFTTMNINNYMVTMSDRKRTEGRLIIFYVNQGEDPETAKIKMRVQNVDPEWEGDLGQIDRIQSSTSKILGGIYIVEDFLNPVDKLNSINDNSSRKKGRGNNNSDPVQVAIPLGVVQYKVVGLYKRIEKKDYIVAFPSKLILNENVYRDNKSSNSKSSNSRSGRGGRGSRN